MLNSLPCLNPFVNVKKGGLPHRSLGLWARTTFLKESIPESTISRMGQSISKLLTLKRFKSMLQLANSSPRFSQYSGVPIPYFFPKSNPLRSNNKHSGSLKLLPPRLRDNISTLIMESPSTLKLEIKLNSLSSLSRLSDKRAVIWPRIMEKNLRLRELKAPLSRC